MKTKAIPLILILTASLLAGCGIFSGPEPTPVPTWTPVVPDSGPKLGGSGGVVASGEIVPMRYLELSFEQNGTVERVEMQEDQQVEQGLLLAQLEGQETLEAGVTAAELALLSAQQELALLNEENEVVQAAAFQQIVEANQVIGDTQFQLDYLNLPTTLQGLETKEALELAKQNYEQARTAFEPYKFLSSGNQTRKDRLEDLERARLISMLPCACWNWKPICGKRGLI